MVKKAKVRSTLIALLGFAFFIAITLGILIAFLLSNLEVWISKALQSRFSKHARVQDVELSLSGITVSDLSIENILSIDTLKIIFLPTELISGSLEGIEATGVRINMDSLRYYLKGEESEDDDSKGKFPSFRINNMELRDVKFSVGNLRFSSERILASLSSLPDSMHISIRAYSFSENALLEKHTDSMKLVLSIYRDSLYVSEGYVHGKEIQASGLNLIVRTSYVGIILDSLNFQGIRTKYLSLDIHTDSSIYLVSSDTLLVGENIFTDLFLRATLKDTLRIDYFEAGFLGGLVFGKGYVKDSTYRISFQARGVVPMKDLLITGSFSIEGLTSGKSLRILVRKAFLKYGDFHFRYIRGYIYTDDMDVFNIARMYVGYPKGAIHGYYVLSKNSWKISFDVDSLELSEFNEFGISGVLEVEGQAIFRDTLIVNAQGNLENVRWKNLSIPLASLKLGIKDTTFHIAMLSESTYVGNFLLRKNELRIGYDGRKYAIDLKTLAPTFAVELSGFLEGKGDTLESRLNLSFENESYRFEVDSINVRSYEGIVELEAVGRNLVLSMFMDSSRIELNGIMNDMDVGKLSSLFGLDSVYGRGTFSFRITGDIRSPKVFLLMDVDRAGYGKFILDHIYLYGFYYDDVVHVDELKLKKDEGVIEGFLRISSAFSLEPFRFKLTEGILNAHFRIDSFPLDYLQHFLQSNVLIQSAYAKGVISVAGKLDQPNMTGSLLLWGSSLMYVPMDMVFKDWSMKLKFRNNNILLERMELYDSYSGSVVLDGYIDANFKERKFYAHMEAELNNLYIMPDEYSEYYVDGKLVLEGYIPSIFVKADIGIVEGYVAYPVGYSPPKKPEPPNPLRYDMNIHGERKLYFENELMDVELSSKLKIQKLEDVGRFVQGEFGIIRGKVYILDREFRIVEGRINVINEEVQLNVVARLELPEDTITAILTGTLKEPQFQLLSKRGLSQYEILALLTLGGGLSERGINLAQQLLSREFRKMLKLTELILSTSGNSALVTFGSYIAENIYVRIVTDLQNPSNLGLMIQYFINQKLHLFGSSEEDKYTVGIGYRIKF